MSTHEHHDDGHGGGGQKSFFGKLSHFFFTYLWSTDHKMIGKQFLFTGLTYFILGGLLALGVRWQLAWPGTQVPLVGLLNGHFFDPGPDGGHIFAAVDGRSYNMLFTMHASVMIFFVIIPLLSGAFGNYL